jgi:hypothetical protein
MKTYIESEVLSKHFLYGEGGESLQVANEKRRGLLVFLRHFGCTFCRETLADLSEVRGLIEAKSIDIVLVHMGPIEDALDMFKTYDLLDIRHVLDEETALYYAFGLENGTIGQLLGIQEFTRGFQQGLLKGRGVSSPKRNSYQMPGVFLLENNQVLAQYIHRSASDNPNYQKVLEKFL